MSAILKLISYFLVNIGLFYVLDQILKTIEIKDWKIVAIFLLALVGINCFILPIIKLLTLPLNFLTFGLLGVVLNFVAIVVALDISGIKINAVGTQYYITILLISCTLSVASWINNIVF
jgi:putative membrane protein